MHIERLRLLDFRSFAEKEITPGREVTVFVGPNAAGKTNLIEAIQVTASTESFRRPDWGELVRWGATRARVVLEAEGRSSHSTLDLEVDLDGKRRYRVNGNHTRRHTDVAGKVPVVVFTPDDLQAVKGSAGQRRAAADSVGEKVWPAYRDARKRYSRILRQRNLLLKEGRVSDPELEPWDEQLSSVGAELTLLRARLVRLMDGAAGDIYAQLTGGDELTLVYEHGIAPIELGDPGGADREELAAAMLGRVRERRADELARRMSLVGPHRDDILFLNGGRLMRSYSSQGEQRSAVLAWKLAEIRAVERGAGRKPVLLLDDVMSELDESRRAALMGVVEEDIQTFVTTTNLAYFDEALVERAEVVSL